MRMQSRCMMRRCRSAAACWGRIILIRRSSLNNLANLYYEQGRYAEAEPLFEEALSITAACWGRIILNTADA